MNTPTVSNPNDFRVVDFTNKTDFDFTPEMGCMFNSNPIFGISGGTGVRAGESLKLPYHVGIKLATNLAKAVMTRQAPPVDPANIPTGVPLWDQTKLDKLRDTFLTDLYSENKPIAKTETEVLLERVNELNRVVETLQVKDKAPATEPSQEVKDDVTVPPNDADTSTEAKVYQDKQEVILELEKRGIKHDKRKGKDELEKLLVNA